MLFLVSGHGTLLFVSNVRIYAFFCGGRVSLTSRVYRLEPCAPSMASRAMPSASRLAFVRAIADDREVLQQKSSFRLRQEKSFL